jgi:hypothetical protein
MKLKTFLSTSMFVSAVVSMSAQQVTFNVPVRDYAVTGSPTGVAVGDFNGDGKLDVVSVSDGVSLLLGNGDGTFQPAVVISTLIGSAIISADFNHDGKLDLAVAANDGVDVMLGNGDGTFQSPLGSFNGLQNSFLAVADFNGDGKPDVVAGESFGIFSVLLGNGDGTFSLLQQVDANAGGGLVTGDFNHDGKPDVAVCSNGSFSVLLNEGGGVLGVAKVTNTPLDCSSISAGHFHASKNEDVVIAFVQNTEVMVYPGNGDGTFGTPSTISAAADFVTVRDMNGDGMADIVTLSSRNDIATVLLGNGEGEFKMQPFAVVGGQPTAAAFGNFNGAAKGPDLAIADTASSTLSILINKGNGTFVEPTNYSIQGSAESVVTVDFNHDGNLDIAVTNSTQNCVSLLLGNANGTFQTAVDYPVGGAPGAIVWGDFNGDGNPDVVTVNSGTGNLSVLLGRGDGTFEPATTIQVAALSLVAGDFNGDGKLDIAGTAGSSVFVLLGNGNGTFGTLQTTPTSFTAAFIVAADFNRDGKLDVAIAAGKDLLVLGGNGNGTFTPGFEYNTDNSIKSLTVGDLNGDGNADLIAPQVYQPGLRTRGQVAGTGIIVLLGAGDGTFPNQLFDFAELSGVSSVATGDFNGDGKLDVVIANSNNNELALFLGNGDGTLQAPIGLPALAFARWLAVGDFNHDNKPDIAVANNKSVGILLNTTQ